MSSDASGPAMLRMVRFTAVKQDADRLRDPRSQDRYESLARILHMGDADTAKRALTAWFLEEQDLLAGDPHVCREDYRTLETVFLEQIAKVNGRQVILNTEIGYYSQNVAPDYGRQTHEYATWATPHLLGTMFSDGHEMILNGHMGTGKTHLAVLFMEEVLRLANRKFVVITNIPGVKDTLGQYGERIHHATRISEVFRIWSELPVDTQILLVIDEPESNIRGGTSKAVRVYQDFVFMNRKLRISRIEIWHNSNEEYQGIRDKENEQIYRVMKERTDSFTITRQQRGLTIHQAVEAVPKLRFLEFSTWGMGSITVDINMAALLRRLEKCTRPEEMKAVVKEALLDASTYLEDHAPEGARTPEQAKDEATTERHARVLAQLKAQPEAYLGMRRQSFDRAKVQAAFGLTQAETNYLCRLAWEALPASAKSQRPRPVLDEKMVEAILAHTDEFLSPGGRAFDREKIRLAFGVTAMVARELARVAWTRRKP